MKQYQIKATVYRPLTSKHMCRRQILYRIPRLPHSNKPLPPNGTLSAGCRFCFIVGQKRAKSPLRKFDLIRHSIRIYLTIGFFDCPDRQSGGVSLPGYLGVVQVMKSRTKVVVIGGGIAGCSTLYHLTQEGWSDVVLVERNELTSGTT